MNNELPRIRANSTVSYREGRKVYHLSKHETFRTFPLSSMGAFGKKKLENALWLTEPKTKITVKFI